MADKKTKKKRPGPNCETCGQPVGEHTLEELADCRARQN